MLKVDFEFDLDGRTCAGTAMIGVTLPEHNPNASREARDVVRKLFSNCNAVFVTWFGGQHSGQVLFIGQPANMGETNG